MAHSAGPGTAAGSHTAVGWAPYALVRATVLRYPAQSPSSAGFRTELARLAALEAAVAELLPRLCDGLYASRGGHPPAYHRDVVLPLRRALHNGREPRPALLTRLGDLPDRIPQLAEWLALRRRRAVLLAGLATSADRALAAERDVLSTLCREPALRRAVALTSSELLRAVERTGTGAQDRKARKEEPGVLRHLLRASTKTSPLSWFTAVGWGELPRTATDHGLTGWDGEGFPADTLTSVVKANRTLVTALTEALLDDPRRRAGLPHRMTSSARTGDGHATYARSRVVFAGGRYLVTAEEEIALADSGPLRLIGSRCEKPTPLPELAGALNTALTTASTGAAAKFLNRLAETGLLVPCDPVDPQDDDPLVRLAEWLRTETDGRSPGRADRADLVLAGHIDEIDRGTKEFTAAEPDRRPALLAGLSQRWHTLLAEAGRPVPTGTAPLNVLSEDVVAPEPLRLDGLLDAADRQALSEVTALAELFDLGHLMRRIARDRFVARYGSGGVCRHPWEFGTDVAEAWEQAGRLAALATADQEQFPTGVSELAALRRTVLDTVQEDGGDVVLPADLVDGLADRLPRWMVQRPLSYSYFLQRGSADGLLCVNHVYGGWGRFTSRFLDSLAPGAGTAVAEQIRQGLGDGARAVQVRPVGGFNANLHPLLVPDEIGPDRRWTSIGEPELDLVHDPASDQVRVRLRATGESLDVLYGGFLAPIMLPRRIAPLLSDHPQGVVDFRPLLPPSTVAVAGGRVVRTPRLRHRHLVLQRRRWHLPTGVVQQLRADLTAEQGVPVLATARWRTRLGLPEQLFLHPAPAARAGRATEDFLTRLGRPKPQFVDLGNPLHLRSLARWLARHPDGAVLEEALPAPGGRDRATGAVELVAELYRAGRPS